jgi:hypothetical protein
VQDVHSHSNIYLSLEGTVLWAVTSYTPTEIVLQLLTRVLLGLHFDPDDGSSIVLRNVGVHHTTRRHIPENITLHSHPYESPKYNNLPSLDLSFSQR